MYSTCLFCYTDLGTNEVIEHLPIGRRLAFDPDKGRLWVVCRKCERWNLTPIEERWEALEECERAFRGTRLRASTEHVALARLREGLELVRIGAPLRPELAAWRYGDQFGRRWRKQLLLVGGGIAAEQDGGGALHVPYALPHTTPRRLANGRLFRPGRMGNAGQVKRTVLLSGEDALRAARQLLPVINAAGAGAKTVAAAVDLLEDAGNPDSLFQRFTQLPARPGHVAPKPSDRAPGAAILMLPPAVRLALEMVSHEEAERRALDGELSALEDAWRDAEEIAAIADNLLLPADTDQALDQLKRDR